MESNAKNLAFRVLDPSAPRFNKDRFNIAHRDNSNFYRKLKETYPELKQYSNTQIGQFIKAINKRVAQEVIDNRNGVKLPEGLGIIVGGACKLNPETAMKNIDHATSRKLGKKVYYQNQISDQFVAKIKYSNELDKHMFDNYNMWCFDADRNLARAISNEFKKEGGYKKYIVFTTKQHIAHLFRKTRINKANRKAQVMKEIGLAEHNEFDI